MANGEGQSEQEGSEVSQQNPEGQEGATREGSQAQTQGQGPQAGDPGQGQGGQQTDPATGGQTGFTHPMLQGRSPEEIDRLVGQMEQTVREQGRQLNRTQQQQGQQGQQARQDGREEVDISDEEFFDQPVEAVRQVVGQQLRETVAPLEEQIGQMARQSQASSQIQQYKNQYPKWDQYEDYMRLMAQRKGLDWDSVLTQPGVVEVLYYAVQGLEQEQGLGQGQQAPRQQAPQQQGPQMGQQGQRQQQPQQQQQGRQPPPPQHQPSSSPMPQPGQQDQQGRTRELNEQEKRLAREYGMSDEEFIAWQEMDAREAVTGTRPGQEG